MIWTLKEICNAVGGTLIGSPDKILTGISTDSRNCNPQELFIALRGERFDGHDFIPSLAGTCGAILTEKEFPGFDQIVVPDTLKALGDLAAAWKKHTAPRYTVGVTGSVGKTTTKELIAGVLAQKYKTHFTRGNFNNQIGVPVTLIHIEEGAEAVVCEMGMSARGEIEKLTQMVRPNVAVITNIGTSHIEILGSREEIRLAKLEILEGMEKGATVIIDGDEPLLHDEIAREKLKDFRVVSVGFHPENDLYPMDIYKGTDHISFDVIMPEEEMRVTVPAVGDHFIKNALFAVAVGVRCGLSQEEIKNGLLTYAPSGLRQKIYLKNGVRVIADCYNASPESMSASLKVLADSEGARKIAVLGDMLELGGFSASEHHKIGVLCAALGIDEILTYGKASYQIQLGALDEKFPKAHVSNSIDAEELSRRILSLVKPGDCVLFKASRRMKLENVMEMCGLTEEEV